MGRGWAGDTKQCYNTVVHFNLTVIFHCAAAYSQRAFVGKVNMDQQSPDFYKEDTQQSLQDTRRCVCVELYYVLCGG